MLESLAAPLAIAALAVALLAVVLALASRRPTQQPPVERAAPDLGDLGALEAVLADLRSRLDELTTEVDGLRDRSASIEEDARRAVQRAGLVRFNPFEDTGSNQSFALALLDGEANGIVLSSLHSRQATRVYLKEIVAGHSDAALSTEEVEALRRAGITD